MQSRKLTNNCFANAMLGFISQVARLFDNQRTEQWCTTHLHRLRATPQAT